jgi:TPP-dependent 2-oxoacid decarboxylase
MRVGEFLFKRIKEEGVTHTFGLPGDYALSLYAAQAAAGLPTVVMTHEPSAGYAADVYGRLKGLGVAIVTYGVGALNMVNAVAMAYAEQSPLLVVAGAPDVHWREEDILFYHRVKSSDTQLKVYQEVTAAQASINDPALAAAEIERVLAAIRRLSRPGLIEIARDLVMQPLPAPPARRASRPAANAEIEASLKEAVAEVVKRLNASRRPLVYAGVEIERFGLGAQLARLLDRTNLPVATSLMGKAVLPEHHPRFVGTYFGSIGPGPVRRQFEKADCILALGTQLTLMDTGIGTGRFDRGQIIQITSQGTTISRHHFPQATLAAMLERLAAAAGLKRHAQSAARPARKPRPPRGPELTTNAVIDELNRFLTRKHLVIADTGDCLFASLDLRADHFIGPGYYASMGLAVPGAIGAQLARPNLRPIVLVGDGAFKMDGVEVATARDLGLNPIVIILNNRTFATLKASAGDQPYFRVRPWDYVALARALGGQGARCRTREELQGALNLAQASDDFWVIDAVLNEADASDTLLRLGQALRKKTSAARGHKLSGS